MNTLGERVKKLREAKGWSQAELARRVTREGYKMGQSAIGNIEARGVKEPKSIVHLARALGVYPAWLQTGLGMKDSSDPMSDFKGPDPLEVKLGLVPDTTQLPESPLSPRPLQPILPDDRSSANPLEVWASAEGGEDGAMLITTGPIDYIPRPGGLPVRGSFAVYLIGDSMSPAYEHGDQLYINTNKPVRGGIDCLFVQEQEDGTLLALAKRLVRPGADKWRVKQFNPPREFDLDRRKWSKAWMVAGKMSRL